MLVTNILRRNAGERRRCRRGVRRIMARHWRSSCRRARAVRAESRDGPSLMELRLTVRRNRTTSGRIELRCPAPAAPAALAVRPGRLGRRPVVARRGRSSDAGTRHPLARGRSCAARAAAPGARSPSAPAPRGAARAPREASSAPPAGGGRTVLRSTLSTPVRRPYSPKLLPKAAARHPADAVFARLREQMGMSGCRRVLYRV